MSAPPAVGSSCSTMPVTATYLPTPIRPDEYDAEATELLWSRVLPFVQVSRSQVS